LWAGGLLGGFPQEEAFTLPKGLPDKIGVMVKSRSLTWRLGIRTLVVILPLVVFAFMMGETTRMALGDRSLPRERGISALLKFREATERAPGGQKVVAAYVPVSDDSTVGAAAGASKLAPAAGASKLALGPGAFLLTTILAALAITGSLVLSYRNSRALARKMRELESRTQAAFNGAPIATTPAGVREFDGLGDSRARPSEFPSLRSDQPRDADQEVQTSQELQTSQDLQTSEEHFRLLADSLPQLVWTARPDGRIDYTSARRENYAAIGRTDWEGIIHPDDRRATAEAWLRASESGLPYEMEHRLFAIGKGYSWHLSRASPLLDAKGKIVRWYGTTTDIDDQKQREENIRDLLTEVNHRSRNLLAVAQAIARCGVSTATTIQEFEQRYSDRLLGLAASQDLLTERNWRGAQLEALVRAQVVLPLDWGGKRFESEGPLVLLNPNATQTLGLALHELCSNALKHGALSNDRGTVSLVWRIDESGAEPNFEITWRERGGPQVSAAAVSGFGAVVLERLTAAGLNASSTLSFDPEGLTWRLIAPLREIVKSGAGESQSQTQQG
jgi:PAS domain S-box-containing protein